MIRCHRWSNAAVFEPGEPRHPKLKTGQRLRVSGSAGQRVSQRVNGSAGQRVSGSAGQRVSGSMFRFSLLQTVVSETLQI